MHIAKTMYVKDVASPDGHDRFTFDNEYLATIVYGRFIVTKLLSLIKYCIWQACAT